MYNLGLSNFSVGLFWTQLAPFADAPEEVDQTIFSVDKFGNIGSASRLAEKVVEEAHRYDLVRCLFTVQLLLMVSRGFKLVT